MQPAIRIIVSLFLLTSTIVSAYQSGAKLRRDGVLNLYPFPRVGRASHRTWQMPYNDIYLDYEPVEKRQLYAFPRVGRSDVTVQEQRQDGFQSIPVKRTENPGMWFGPRLGRSFRNNEDELTIQNEDRDRREPEQIDVSDEERKKRQTGLY